MKTTAPYWFKLIRYQTVQNLGDALTLAFLFGAHVRKAGKVEDLDGLFPEDLVSFIQHIADSMPADYATNIYRCSKLGEPVMNHFSSLYLRSGIKSSNGERISVQVDKEFASTEAQRTAEAVGRRLWKELGSHIRAGRFSFKDGVYRPFDRFDLRFMQQADDYDG